MSVQQLRDKIGQLLTAAGQQTVQQKTEYLGQYFSKWSMQQQRMTHQQFIGALQSLHLPLYGAADVFTALDRDGSGLLDIREFVDAMIAGIPFPATSKPRLATRTAGNDIVMSGRRASSDRYARTNPLDAPPSERGYTPLQGQAMQKVGSGSRTGSRTSSANRSPNMPGTPKPEMVTTVKFPIAAANSRAQANRAPTPVEVDFSDLVVAKFREIVLQRGGSSGIRSLGRIFRIMDNDGNRKLSPQELQSGLNDYGLSMNMKDLSLLLVAIDKDGTGAVSFDEFMLAVRGVVNSRRQQLIGLAFDVLDSTGDGQIQVDDLVGKFDTRGHPDVMNGTLTEEHALSQFLSQFDGVDQNGIVTRAEFLDYYRNVSASIDDDDYFELMIRNAWHLGGGAGQYQSTANTHILVKLIDGSQKVVALEHDLGLDVRNAVAVKAALRAQGITNVASFTLGAS